MLRILALLVSLIIMPLAAATSHAADAAAGKAKAAVCFSCHGPAGISSNPQWPNLAGQKAEYIVEQLKEFKTGARRNALMSPQAKNLSNDDISNLAAYFSSLKCSP